MMNALEQTKIGVVPSDWKAVELIEVLELQRGYDLPVQNRAKGEYPLIGSNGVIDYHNECRVEGPTIVTGRSGTIGKIYYEAGSCWPLNTTLYVKDTKGNYPKYLFYLLQSVDLSQYSTGTGVPTLNRNIVHKHKVAIPPLPEQQKIAEILSTVDEKIAVIDEQLAQTQELKKGLMQRLLTRGIGHTTFKDSPLGQIPESWEAYILSKAAWYQEGPGLRKWQFTDTGIKVINITNMVDGVLELSKTARHIAWEEFQSKYRHFECAAGDIVIASSGNSYCKHAIVREQDLPLVMNTSVIRFQPIGKTVYGFLNQFLKSEMFKKQIDFLITGGAQPNFGPEHLGKVFIPIPPPEEQYQITEILNTVDDKLQVLTDKKTQYQELKRGLMQQLLTGQRRVKVVEPAMA